jgi:predicted dehydrogenase
VIRAKQENWRSRPDEGGGCLMDYASHVIDLLNHIVGPIKSVHGSLLKSYYSKDVEDAVHSLLESESGTTGVLSVNWSDETYRKMSTSITINGTLAKIICDTNELKVYFKTTTCPQGYEKGWNIRHITDLTRPVDFYLRGEEYSAQIDYFISSIEGKVPNTINTFASASHTDKVISLIKTTATK